MVETANIRRRTQPVENGDALFTHGFADDCKSLNVVEMSEIEFDLLTAGLRHHKHQCRAGQQNLDLSTFFNLSLR